MSIAPDEQHVYCEDVKEHALMLLAYQSQHNLSMRSSISTCPKKEIHVCESVRTSVAVMARRKEAGSLLPLFSDC